MKRPRVVVLALAGITVVLALLLHRPLLAWFTGADISGGGKPSATAKASAGPFALELALRPDPPRQEGNALLVLVKDANGKPVDGAAVTVEYLMPAMGAMSEMKGMATVDNEDGSFRAQFDLPMAGSWTLTTRVRAPQGSGEVRHTITVGNKGLGLVGGSSTVPSAAGSPATVAPLKLAPQALGAVQEAMSSLDQVRAKLAADGLDGVAAPAARAATMLRDAAKLIDAPDAKERLDEGASAADALGRTRDLEAARKLFAVTSSSVVALAVADARLQAGWQIFACPMVDASYGAGRNKWLQRGDALENPYMGKQMLTCGSASTFTMPAHDDRAHARDDRAHGDRGDANEVEYYTCSMHPSVKQGQPGTCPICAMTLTPVTKGELQTGVVLVDDIRRQKIGVKTARVERRAVAASITTVGRVVYDEAKLQDVTLKVGGFVEELFVDETGQKVSAGQPLFLLYSPELYAAQVEYLQALKAQKTLAGSDFADSLVRSARRRLELWDLADKQIEELGARGEATDKMPILAPASGYVVEKNIVRGAKLDEGATAYRIANLDTIWIEADVYEADLPKVKVGQAATVTLAYLPGKEHVGKVGFIFPFLDKGTRSGRVRIEMKNPGLELKPEMFANVTLRASEGEQLVVPESAVVYTGPRRLVFVDLGEGRLKPVAVRLGRKTGELFEVLDGLQEGDVIVTSGNFLIAAESRLKGATEYWAEDSQPPAGSTQPAADMKGGPHGPR